MEATKKQPAGEGGQTLDEDEVSNGYNSSDSSENSPFRGDGVSDNEYQVDVVSMGEEEVDESWHLNEAERQLLLQILLPAANKELYPPARFPIEELKTMNLASLEWFRNSAYTSILEMKKNIKCYLASIVAFRTHYPLSGKQLSRKRRKKMEKRVKELEDIIVHYHLTSNDFVKEICDINYILAKRR